MTTKEWGQNFKRGMKQSLTKSWKRFDAALSGELMTKREVARRMVDDLEKHIAEDVIPRLGELRNAKGEPVEFKFLVKEKEKLSRKIVEAYQDCELNSAEVGLFTKTLAKLIPDLQQVEVNQRTEHNHVVHIPMRSESSVEWSKAIEGEARRLSDEKTSGSFQVLPKKEAQKA